MANHPTSQHDWHHTAPGRQVAVEEAPILEEMIRRLHGDVLVWSGAQPPEAVAIARCMIRHCFYAALPGALDVAPAATEGREFSHFTSSLTELALPANSVDGFVVHYGLEGVADQRAALRELARVLAYGGRLVICAINPLSLWGVRGLYGRLRPDMLSNLHFISPLRMIDWLAVLGFEIDQKISYMAYGQPLGSTPGMSRFSKALKARQLPVGGVYLLTAIKSAVGVRPLRHRRGVTSNKLAVVAYPRLSSWNRGERGS